MNKLLSKFKSVAVGMSGGVDSAVAALLLKDKGLLVKGVFMRNWDEIDETGVCSADRDCEDAMWVCNKLEIPFYQVSFVKEYWTHVFSELLQDYQEGYTPNPDILCNRDIKFNKFLEYSINNLGVDAISTGHYARSSFGSYLENSERDKNAKLLMPVDATKDQTFFLSQIPQSALRKTMFPLADLTKKEVKQIAADSGFDRILKKKESMGICFIGSRKFYEFISEYVPDREGNFIDIETGKIVGKHSGIHHWTLGQRSKIGGYNDPYYIAKKIVSTGDMLVALGANHPALTANMMLTKKPYWIDSEPPPLKDHKFMNCKFRFQHTHGLVDCRLIKTWDEKLFVILDEPLVALTPGQYAVFYEENECLGSARIEATGPSTLSINLEEVLAEVETEKKAMKKKQ